jgi:hypothetical protein
MQKMYDSNRRRREQYARGFWGVFVNNGAGEVDICFVEPNANICKYEHSHFTLYKSFDSEKDAELYASEVRQSF